MTLAQIFAVLSVLSSFGVDQATVNRVHDILIPPVVNIALYVPVQVIQTPIVQNQPVYFGSINSPQVQSPAAVLQSISMDKSEIVINQVRQYPPEAGNPHGYADFRVSVLDKDGNNIITSVRLDAPDNAYGDGSDGNANTNRLTNESPTTDSKSYTGWVSYIPTSAGEKTVTLTSGDLTKTTTITFP